MTEDIKNKETTSRKWDVTLRTILYGYAFGSGSIEDHIELAIKNFPDEWTIDSIKDAIVFGLNQNGSLQDILFDGGRSDSELRELLREILKELGSGK